MAFLSSARLTAVHLPKPASKPPVIAIGLDAADPKQLQNWMAAEHLPNLVRLRDRGAYGPIKGPTHYKAETPWSTFLTGVSPQTSGYWGEIKFRKNTYELQDIQAYGFDEYPPFYALGDRYRVAVFDVPKARVNADTWGQQMLAWGAHSPSTPQKSFPSEVFAQVKAQFGPHPTYNRDHGNWWDRQYLHQLRQGLSEGIRRRSAICQSWLRQEPWDLFLTAFGELHSAGHDFWFVSDPTHPLYSERSRFFPGENPLLEVYKHVDQAIGEIIEAAPQNANIIVFSLHGHGPNTSDVPAMFFLAEFLYRYSFPRSRGRIAVGNCDRPLPRPCFRPRRQTWSGEIWSRRHDPRPLRGLLRQTLPSAWHPHIDRCLGSIHSTRLASPQALKAAGVPFAWQPASWYQPLWPKMQAFALPSFSEGYIRINLQGREPEGQVPPEDYERVCDQITAALQELYNPRTDSAVVKEVIRTRDRHDNHDSGLPDADLIVEWSDPPADVVESPRYGRIGPVPFRRTGSHRAEGFLLAQGPDIEPGSTIPLGTPVDISATLLALMGAPIPEHFQGKPLLQSQVEAPER